MISINRCRSLLLYLLSKNNYGTIDPEKFNSFCDLGQMSVFEELFYRNNTDTVKKDNHLTNSQYADLKKIREEQIDYYSKYSTPTNFTYNLTDDLWQYVNDDLYRAVNISLVNTATNKKVTIQEKLKGIELNNSINSKTIPPTTTFPICVRLEDDFRVYPKAPIGYNVELLYIRKPKIPKWTYTVQNGNAIFNGGASDRQDIDLHDSLFEKFMIKICGYAGLSLREEQVSQAVAQESLELMQKQQ